MWHYFKEHAKAFWVGFTGSGVVWANILFADIGPFSDPVLTYILRVAGATGIAFAAGLATCLATDFHKELKKRYKNFKDGKRKREPDKKDRAA
jgi:hypothetical protein